MVDDGLDDFYDMDDFFEIGRFAIDKGNNRTIHKGVDLSMSVLNNRFGSKHLQAVLSSRQRVIGMSVLLSTMGQDGFNRRYLVLSKTIAL